MANYGMGSRGQGRDKPSRGYTQKNWCFDPAFWERFDKLRYMMEGVLNIRLTQMDFLTVLYLCTHDTMLSPTLQLELERKCPESLSLQSEMRVKILREKLNQAYELMNANPQDLANKQ